MEFSWLDPTVVIANAGAWAVVVVTVIIFLENAFVVTSFLPGDSLLFVLGLTLASPQAPIPFIAAIFMVCAAAILGSVVSFVLGELFGTRFLANHRVPFFSPRWVNKSREFFDKHGNRAIVLSRFVPIVRALVPFLAGTTGFPRRMFARLNVIGALVWVVGLTTVGYLLGEIPTVKEHLDIAIVVVVVVTSLPFPIEITVDFIRDRRAKRKFSA